MDQMCLQTFCIGLNFKDFGQDQMSFKAKESRKMQKDGYVSKGRTFFRGEKKVSKGHKAG